jgi:hypothetical protein
MEAPLMDPSDRKEAALSPEDLQRMRRLSEEIQGRLTEMVLILSRTLDVQFGDAPTLHYRPEPEKVDEWPGGQHINLVCTPDGSVCGCYVDPPGICVMGGGVGC